MTARPLLGVCPCLLPACGYPRAELRLGTNATAYLSCPKCTTTVRTASRAGDLALRALVVEASPPVAIADPLAAAGDAISSPRPAMATSPSSRAASRTHRRARR